MKKLFLIILFLFFAANCFALNVVKFNPRYYPDPTKGKPISLGYIYVGEPDTDPEIAGNQKTVSVLQENGSVVTVTQPISTNAGGVPTYNGSTVTLLVDGDYSLKVLDSLGSQVYYIPSDETLLTANNLSQYGCDLDAAVTAIGAVNSSFLTVDCDCIIASGTTVTATDNITLNFTTGTVDGVSGGSAETLTINGPVRADSGKKIFNNALTVNYASESDYLLSWRGGNLETANADCGSNTVRLIVDTEPDDLTSAINFLSGITLIWKTGTIGGAYNFTVRGPFEFPLAQVFEATIGTVVLDTTQDLYPEWWDATSGSDFTNAINTALQVLNATGFHIPLFFHQGEYTYTNTILVPANSIIRGSGEKQTFLNHRPTASDVGIQPFDITDKTSNVTIENLSLVGDGFVSGSNSTIGIYLASTSYWDISNVWIRGFSSSAVSIYGQRDADGNITADLPGDSTFNKLTNCVLFGGQRALRLGGTIGTVRINGGTSNMNTFVGCYFTDGSVQTMFIDQGAANTFLNCSFDTAGGANIYISWFGNSIFGGTTESSGTYGLQFTIESECKENLVTGLHNGGGHGTDVYVDAGTNNQINILND